MADFTVNVEVVDEALEVVVVPAAVLETGGVTSYEDLTDVPTTFPPEAHNHDDRYYTETESDGRYVRTVNSVGPDGAGNVTVETEDGGLAALTSHIDDTSDAHDASAVSYAGNTNLSSNNVESALDELDNEKASVGSVATVQTNVDNHVNDTSAAHAASAISYAGGTGMSATDAEAAIDELATEKANASDLSDHLSDASAAHAASAVSFSPTGTVAATDVQAAIAEVASEAASAGFRTHNLAFNGAPTTPASSLYIATLFNAIAPSLQVIGALVRTTVNGVSYTLTLRANAAPSIILATKAFTGTGSPVRVRFDSSVALTYGTDYELGYSTASATNMRIISSGFMSTDGPDIGRHLGSAHFGVTAQSQDGITTSRALQTGFAASLRLDYQES